MSPVPSSTASPATLPDGTTDNRVMMLSLLLWAGALIAIVILMLHLWRNWSIPPRTKKSLSAEPPVEEKSTPAVEIVSEPSHEELERDFQNGIELVRAGKASEGIATLTRVVRSEPENNIAWFWLGIASARQKDFRSAERCFLQAKRHGHPEADKALEWLKKQK